MFFNLTLENTTTCELFKVETSNILALENAFSVTDKPSLVIVPVDYSENMKLTKHLGEIVSKG